MTEGKQGEGQDKLQFGKKVLFYYLIIKSNDDLLINKYTQSECEIHKNSSGVY